jgi:type I restriction enzyme S subunit
MNRVHPIRTLAEACSFIGDGTHESPERTVTGVPVLSAQNIQDGRLVTATSRHTSAAEYQKFRNRVALTSGDVLMTIVGSVGRVAVLEDEEPLVFQRSVAILRPNPITTDSRFLFYALQRPGITHELESRTNKSAQAGVYLSKLSTLPIPLPPVPEQRRIAALFDKADAIRRKRQQAIRLADDLLRSAFLDMFGNPVSNPRRWPTLPIAEMAEVVTGNTPPRNRLEYYGNAIEWIKSDNINTPSHVLTAATEGLSDAGRAVARTVPAGSTLMTCIAGSPSCIGNCALADREVAFNQQINAVVPGQSLDSAFLYVELLLAKPLVQGASTDSMKGMVSKGRLAQLRLPCPPLQLQLSFGRWARTFLRWRDRLQDSVIAAESLAGALAAGAFAHR